jgi:ABC-type transporter Mla subunit MlaD
VSDGQYKEAVDLANKAFDVGATLAKSSQGLDDLKSNFQSHKEDIYRRIDDSNKKLESLPDKNEIQVMFTKESEKLANGIMKHIDKLYDNIEDAKKLANQAEKLAKSVDQEIKISKRHGYIFATLVGLPIIGWIIKSILGE